jgi:hypothetical protein
VANYCSPDHPRNKHRTEEREYIYELNDMKVNGDCTRYGIATRAEGEKQSTIVTANETALLRKRKIWKLHQFEVFKVESKYSLSD